MADTGKSFRRVRRYVFCAAFLFVVALILTGCQTVSYYKQAIQGQYQIWACRRPIEELIADPKTSQALKEKLRLVLKMREFAEKDLKLPVNGHYLRYADVQRRFVVWNAHAAPEFSLEPKTWWYPIVGSLKYRGYFSEKHARAYGKTLEKKGFDVYVGGVEAYSTLGWFKDPVLNTFIHHAEADLAEILFHELAHQRVFASGDTDFNEAFATAVAEEAVRRWLRSTGDSAACQKYLEDLQRHDAFVRLVKNARRDLKALYDEEAAASNPGNHQSAAQLNARKRQEKHRVLARLQEDHQRLKATWGGSSNYDNWFRGPLNNAQLNTVDTYYHLVPAFHRLLRASEGNLEKFYDEASRLANLRKQERHRQLEMLLNDSKETSSLATNENVGATASRTALPLLEDARVNDL
jgi:Predicted aminopeptidase